MLRIKAHPIQESQRRDRQPAISLGNLVRRFWRYTTLTWVLVLLEGACLVALLMVAFSGCAGLPPETRPAAEQVLRDLPAMWTAEAEVGPLSASLLDLVGDAHLRELVLEALAANHDLLAAAHRLEASRRLLAETRALGSPTVAAEASRGRGNQGVDALGQVRTETRRRLSLGVSWELDVWRRLSDLQQADAALAESRVADLAAARDALGARVIQVWVTAVSLRQAMAVEVERIRVLERLQNTITRRYRRGIGSLDDLAAARAGTELARATVVGLEADLGQAHRALELLLGRLPRNELESADALPEVGRVSPGVPATAIARRPDVIAALWRLQSVESSASAAAKARLPGLRLTGEWAKDAASGFPSAATAWSLLGALTQPIFQRGVLKARSDAQRLELEAAWQDYRGVVLRAVGEVEDALARERSLLRRRDHVGTALGESKRTADIFEGRYRAGLAGVLELLQAEGQTMDIERQAVALNGELLSNRITLALAVGTGFEELEP